AGSSIIFWFVVSNSGDVPLTDFSVTDTSFSGTGTPPAITCPDTSLVPGDSRTCSAAYTGAQPHAAASSPTTASSS
ncbi:DUF7507 domain-containing protein, partial [Streptomyces sp. BE303]|uniref:DUF7507 domain-containing protein n=1 Tax=Streptomyces sp. BE303 TaxID=3002528 RepID=UPI002E7A4932